jgi:hypothetical protein|tara:strand:+ start:116 stop:283 length:168 start_codon:yes stop_codon:yes gene_type:complete
MKIGDLVKPHNLWKGRIGRVIKMGSFSNYFLIRWLDGQETWEEDLYLDILKRGDK